MAAKWHLNGTDLVHADGVFGGPEVGPSISVSSSKSIHLPANNWLTSRVSNQLSRGLGSMDLHTTKNLTLPTLLDMSILVTHKM
jgi:hypothetical protein